MPLKLPRGLLAAAFAAAFLLAAGTSPALGVVPVNLTVPSISGTAEQGKQLSCSQGSWLNNPTSFAYSWQRNGVDLASGSSYVPTASDVGQPITCTVVASNLSGSSLPALSGAVIPVALPSTPAPSVPVNTGLPAISGTPAPGQVLSCAPGSWSPSATGYSFTWHLGGMSIPGATSSTYTPSTSVVGQTITCVVVASDAAGSSLPAISPPVIPALAPAGISGTGGGSGSGGAGGGGRAGGSAGAGGGSSATGSTPSRTGGSNHPPAGAVPGVTRPALESLSFTQARLTLPLRRHGSRIQLRYRLDRAAGIMIAVVRMTGVHKYVVLGVIAIKRAGAGSHSVSLPGRIARQLLRPGRYVAGAAAANAAGWSAPRAASLTVRRGHGARRH